MQHIKNQGKKSYSFSKAKRFQQTSTNYITANYNISRNLNDRSYSIGKGPRSDFTKSFSNAPSPTQYMISSVFNITKEKGVTFGISREKTKELGYIIQGIQKNPGVGNYNCFYQYDTKIQYTMRPKTQSNWLPNFLQEQSMDCNPGPGKYDSTDIDQLGQTVSTRFRRSKCYKMGKEERFTYIRQNSPGPNTYKQTDNLNDSGLYYESKYQGHGKRIICKEPRKSFIDQIYQQSKCEKRFFKQSHHGQDNKSNLQET